MPIINKVDQDLHTIIRTVLGELTVAAVKQAFVESMADPRFEKNMAVIWDLTEADVSQLSASQLREIVGYLRNNTDDRGADYAIAIVAPADISFGISRMFEGYGDSLSMPIRVLRDFDEACRWIKGGVSD